MNSINSSIKNVFFIVACSALNFSMAQSILPDVISSSGTSFNNGTSQLDFTLGEATTSTLTDGNSVLTQGFHQPNLIITSIIASETNYTLIVFPNPTSDILQLQFDKLLEVVIIELFTNEGKLLQSEQLSAPVNFQLNMSNYASGTYLLSVKDQSLKVKTYQIIKSK